MGAHEIAVANDKRRCLAARRESEQTFTAAAKRKRRERLAYFDGGYRAAKFGHWFRDLVSCA